MGYYDEDGLGPGEVEWLPPPEEPLDVEEVPHSEPYEEIVGAIPPDYRNGKRPGADPYAEGDVRPAIDLPCKDFGKIKGCGAIPKERCHFKHAASINKKRVEIEGERSMPCLARLRWAAQPW